jgi:hypothetical protein
MSWSTRTKYILKAEADAAIDALVTGTNEPVHEDQLRVAKQAAKLILANISGPMITVSLSGHANGVGWNKKEDWSSDSISVNVTQQFSAPV